MAYQTNIPGLNATNRRIDGLMADFSGLQNLEKMVSSVLKRLELQPNVNQQVQLVRSGTMSRENFDGWFSDVVRTELGKVLGVQRNKAVQKARAVGAGSASSAVLRRMYREEYGGNINIATPRGRMSSRTRNYQPGWLKQRHVGDRTRKINEYYGPDRGFILRFLNAGTDMRRTRYGNRGAIAPRNWFGPASQQQLQHASANLDKMIDDIIRGILY